MTYIHAILYIYHFFSDDIVHVSFHNHTALYPVDWLKEHAYSNPDILYRKHKEAEPLVAVSVCYTVYIIVQCATVQYQLVCYVLTSICIRGVLESDVHLHVILLIVFEKANNL